MNIKRAKEEIKDAIEAYLLKNEYKEYEIPPIRQRPVLLLGAPGIGKTQIMEQIAGECGIGLVSYTITHHTRQSAIGLPFVSRESFGGKEYTVTEYTMSEIVAAVYHKIEKTGLKEGILFIDEINCVSETLAPAMLQFLQCKAFGNHQIPLGWIIVAAGNPPEYNKSVREFDVVTMDRVKKIEVEPDYTVWKEYAYESSIHGAILSYLNTKPAYFYQMETTVDGQFFATPRGWEDLSRFLEVYEKLGKPMDREVVQQYIQHPKIARDFANYLELYKKYQTDYQMEAVFRGEIDEILIKKISHASFDERLSVMGLLLSRCGNFFRGYWEEEQKIERLHGVLLTMKEALLGEHIHEPVLYSEELLKKLEKERETEQKAELLSHSRRYSRLYVEDFLEKCVQEGKGEQIQKGEQMFALIKERFSQRKAAFDMRYRECAETLEYAFDFMERVFGNSQEMVSFVTELSIHYYSMHFLQQYDCPRYYQYNKNLLFEEVNQELLKRIEHLL